jgi:Tfp pilus assembly protein FimT
MRTMTPRNPNAGFSLLELMVTVGILMIILAVAFRLMAESQIGFDRNQILAEAHQNADFAVSRVSELIRGAGAQPNGLSTVNTLPFISNKETSGSANNTQLIHIYSDLDGDGETIDRVSEVETQAEFYLVSSEDVVIKYYENDTTEGGVDIPGHSICMIDKTAGDLQDVPIVLASNIVAFECPYDPANPTTVTLTLTGGPTRNVPETDPRYITFTRVAEIRLRNRT